MKTREIIFCLAFLLGCSGASKPAATTPATVRAEARAAVDVAKDAWVTAANACISVAQATGKDNSKCAEVLQPAHDAIVDAADGVDAMDPNATVTPAGVACNLKSATLAILKVQGLLPADLSAVINPLLDDAVKLASKLGVCPVDGGVE